MDSLQMINDLALELSEENRVIAYRYMLDLKGENKEPEFGSKKALDDLMELYGSIDLSDDFDEEKHLHRQRRKCSNC